MEEEVERLERLIAEDNVDEVSKILNSNENLQKNFNSYVSSMDLPLLHLAVNFI